MKSFIEVSKDLGVVLLSLLLLCGLLGFCFTLGKRVEKDIEHFWKIVKYEFIIGIFINIFLWAANSLKLHTIENMGEFVIIYLVIFFSLSALGWNHYKRKRLPLEKSSLFARVSDGYGLRGLGPKGSVSTVLALNLVFIILLTIFNIVNFIFDN